VTPAPGSPPAVIPPTVRGLSLVSFLNDFASEMVYPLLPAFVTRVLGSGAMALGALDGAADLTAAALRWVTGRLADRRGWSDRLITAGYGLAVAVRPLVAATTAAWQVVGLRVLDRVGKGLRSPARDAMIARVTAPEARGRAYGYHRGADHLGAVAGSLAAWLLLSWQLDVRGVILASVVPGVLALLVLIPVLRRARGQATGRAGGQAGGRGDSAPGQPIPAGPAAVSDASGSRFWLPVTGLTLLTVARLPETLTLLRMQDLGLAVALVPLIWGGLHIVRTFAAYPGGWLSDRFGSAAMLAAGGALFALIALQLSRPLALPSAVAVFLLLGLVSGLMEPGERAVVARLAPRRTGRAFGYAQGLSGLAALPAGLAFGAVYQRSGGPAALLASAAVSLLAVAVWAGAARSLK
jgi:MFS family permease